ncbi:unnamed protein product [Chrysoparadoxa australica]
MEYEEENGLRTALEALLEEKTYHQERAQTLEEQLEDQTCEVEDLQVQVDRQAREHALAMNEAMKRAKESEVVAQRDIELGKASLAASQAAGVRLSQQARESERRDSQLLIASDMALASARAEASEALAELSVKKEKEAEMKEELSGLAKRLAESESMLACAKEETARLELELKTTAATLTSSESAMAQALAETQVAEEQLKNAASVAQQKRAESYKEILALEARVTDLEDENQALRDEISRLNEEEEKRVEESKARANELGETRKRSEEALNQLVAKKEELSHAMSEAIGLSQQLTEMEKALTEAKEEAAAGQKEVCEARNDAMKLLAAKEAKLAQVQAESSQVLQQLAAKEEELRVAEERVAVEKAIAKEAVTSQASAAEALASMEAAEEIRKAEAEALLGERDVQLQEKENQLNAVQSEGDLKAKKLQEALEALKTRSLAADNLQGQVLRLTEQCQDLQSALSLAKDKLEEDEELIAAGQTATTTLTEAKARIGLLEVELTEAEGKTGHVEAELDRQVKEAASWEEQAKVAQAKIEQLEGELTEGMNKTVAYEEQAKGIEAIKSAATVARDEAAAAGARICELEHDAKRLLQQLDEVEHLNEELQGRISILEEANHGDGAMGANELAEREAHLVAMENRIKDEDQGAQAALKALLEENQEISQQARQLEAANEATKICLNNAEKKVEDLEKCLKTTELEAAASLQEQSKQSELCAAAQAREVELQDEVATATAQAAEVTASLECIKAELAAALDKVKYLEEGAASSDEQDVILKRYQARVKELQEEALALRAQSAEAAKSSEQEVGALKESLKQSMQELEHVRMEAQENSAEVALKALLEENMELRHLLECKEAQVKGEVGKEIKGNAKMEAEQFHLHIMELQQELDVAVAEKDELRKQLDVMGRTPVTVDGEGQPLSADQLLDNVGGEVDAAVAALINERDELEEELTTGEANLAEAKEALQTMSYQQTMMRGSYELLIEDLREQLNDAQTDSTNIAQKPQPQGSSGLAASPRIASAAVSEHALGIAAKGAHDISSPTSLGSLGSMRSMLSDTSELSDIELQGEGKKKRRFRLSFRKSRSKGKSKKKEGGVEGESVLTI